MGKIFGKIILTGTGLLGLVVFLYAGANTVRYIGATPCTEKPPVEEGVKVLKVCDGKTKVIVGVDGLKPGEMMPRETAEVVAKLIWDKYHEMTESSVQPQKEIVIAHGKEEHTKRDMMIWDTELKKVIDEGYKWFHSPEIGTSGISCDMCHPDASNTHPETYPKFQTQLKKVALLRDMINWCIENPLEGKRLNEDDPKMKALEAYMISSRKSKVLSPGKH